LLLISPALLLLPNVWRPTAGYKSIEDFRGKLKPYVKHTSTYGRKMASERHDQDAGALTKRPAGDMMQYVAAALAAVVAFLLADKFGLVATFP
jgi:hypothetical protein